MMIKILNHMTIQRKVTSGYQITAVAFIKILCYMLIYAPNYLQLQEQYNKNIFVITKRKAYEVKVEVVQRKRLQQISTFYFSFIF